MSGFCHTGVIDMNGTEPCVFKEDMEGGVSKIEELRNRLPFFSCDELVSPERVKDCEAAAVFKSETTDLADNVCVCRAFDPKTGICKMSNLNIYKICQHVKNMLGR